MNEMGAGLVVLKETRELVVDVVEWEMMPDPAQFPPLKLVD